MLDIVRPLTSTLSVRPTVRFREILDIEIDSLYRPRTFAEAQQLRTRDRLESEARVAQRSAADAAAPAADEFDADAEPDRAEELSLLDSAPVDTRTFLDTRALFDRQAGAIQAPQQYIDPLTGQAVGVPSYSLLS